MPLKFVGWKMKAMPLINAAWLLSIIEFKFDVSKSVFQFKIPISPFLNTRLRFL